MTLCHRKSFKFEMLFSHCASVMFCLHSWPQQDNENIPETILWNFLLVCNFAPLGMTKQTVKLQKQIITALLSSCTMET